MNTPPPNGPTTALVNMLAGDERPTSADEILTGAPAAAEKNPDGIQDAPTEPDKLAQSWQKKLKAARKHWEPFHKRVAHNRATVAGFDWSKDPTSTEFYNLRANLIHSTITATMPAIYARNPEISVSPIYKSKGLKLFCKTLEGVTNRHMKRAQLKARAKATVRAALTTSIGVVKCMYQRDIRQDPVIVGRMNDTQDNILAIEKLMADIDDPEQCNDMEVKKLELQALMESLNQQVEITAAEGLVIDRVLTEHLVPCPSVTEFSDYPNAPFLAQIIPMRRSDAESTYKIRLKGATPYESGRHDTNDKRLASAKANEDTGDDPMIAILEVWDKATMTVFTLADGLPYFVRKPFSPPKAGERWYPFFLLPFQMVDGNFVGPSLVDLTEKLQKEHNDARDQFNEHRKLNKPGYIAGNDVSEKSIKRFQDAEIGEITIIDSNGQPLSNVFVPKNHPPMDPMMYDTGSVRVDWEQVTGLQDAARSTITEPKTATEASIMQQSLAGRVSDFRDQVEDWIQEICDYAAQILLFELTPEQVERIMGPNESTQQQLPDGTVVDVPGERRYEWPELSREEIYDLIDMEIRPGSTGAPNRLEEQENWGKILPVIEGLVLKITELRGMGADDTPFVNLLKETLRRFDDKLEPDDFIPAAPQLAAPAPGLPPIPGMPGAPGAPGAPGTPGAPMDPAAGMPGPADDMSMAGAAPGGMAIA